MGQYPQLNPGALVRLRAVARALHQENGQAVPLDQLVSLVREVQLDAGVTIDFQATRDLGQPLVVLRLASCGTPSWCLRGLSQREREVAALVARGLSNKQIARRLFITLATVKDHVHRILVKSGLPNRTAVAAAFQGRGPS